MYSARILGSPDTPVALVAGEGSISMDVRRTPHVSADVTLKLTEPVLALLDPRESRRMVLDVFPESHQEPVYTTWTEQRRNRIPTPNPGTYAGSGWRTSAAAFTGPKDGEWCKVAHTSTVTAYVFTDGINEAIAIGDKLTLTVQYRVDAKPTQLATHVYVAPHKSTGNVYYNAAKVTRPIVVGQVETVQIQWTATEAMAANELDIALVTSNAAGVANTVNAGWAWGVRRPTIERGHVTGEPFGGDTYPTGELLRTRFLGTANVSASVLETRTLTGWEQVPDGSPRTFNLGVRTATPDRAAGTIKVHLASDEAILADYAPAGDFYAGIEWYAQMEVPAAPLRGVVANVLDLAIDAALEPGTFNPDVTPKFTAVNMLRNPAVVGSALNWTAGGGCTIAFTAAGSSGYIRVVPSAATGAVFACDTTKWNLNATPGREYYFRLPVRAETAGGAGRLVLRWLDGNNDLIRDDVAFSVTSIGLETVTLGIAAKAPANAVKVAPYFRFTVNRVYRLDNGLLIDNEAGWPVGYFSGGDTNTSEYMYAFEGASNDSPSTRTPVIERSDDTMIWRAGTSALAFLGPLLQANGARLVCDEQRRWTIREADWTAPGTQAYEDSLITFSEETTRDTDEWFDAAVFRYRWTDRNGLEQTRDDVYKSVPSPTKTIRRDIATPFPGPGRAEAAVTRALTRGSTATITAQARWNEATEQTVTILTGGVEVSGLIDQLTYNLGRNEVTLIVRAG